MYIYSLNVKIFNLQAIELHGKFQPHSMHKGLVGEYHFCGLEYFLGPNAVNKWVFSQGAK